MSNNFFVAKIKIRGFSRNSPADDLRDARQSKVKKLIFRQRFIKSVIQQTVINQIIKKVTQGNTV